MRVVYSWDKQIPRSLRLDSQQPFAVFHEQLRLDWINYFNTDGYRKWLQTLNAVVLILVWIYSFWVWNWFYGQKQFDEWYLMALFSLFVMITLFFESVWDNTRVSWFNIFWNPERLQRVPESPNAFELFMLWGDDSLYPEPDTMADFSEEYAEAEDEDDEESALIVKEPAELVEDWFEFFDDDEEEWDHKVYRIKRHYTDGPPTPPDVLGPVLNEEWLKKIATANKSDDDDDEEEDTGERQIVEIQWSKKSKENIKPVAEKTGSMADSLTEQKISKEKEMNKTSSKAIHEKHKNSRTFSS